MSARRHSLHWRPGQPFGEPDTLSQEGRVDSPAAPLRIALTAVAEWTEDRVAPARELLRGVSAALFAWARRAPELTLDELERLPRESLAALRAAHAWRGPVARWFVALEGLPEAARALGARPFEVLCEELGLWLDGAQANADGGPWDGIALHPGVRLPQPEACALPFPGRVTRGETIALLGASWTACHAILELQGRGLEPRVLVPEGVPDLTGRRMAEDLLHHGVPVRIVYDAAMHGCLAGVDRLWCGTEAIGAAEFLAPVGARALFEQAVRLEVPTCILATSDKLVPGGRLELPSHYARDPSYLWPAAPDGAQVESQALECVPLCLVAAIASEAGLTSVAQLALHALSTERSPAPERAGAETFP